MSKILSPKPIPASEKGAASGVATLDADGYVTEAQRGAGALYLPGVSGNYASCPDTSVLDITGDIDIRAKIAPDDWTPSTTNAILCKSEDFADTSYRLELISSGGSKLRFRWSTDGTGGGIVTTVSTASPAGTNGEPLWVRATLDADDGAGGYVVTFYTSENGTDWTQLGSTVTDATTTSIYSGNADIEVGSRNAGANDQFAGLVYQVQVYDGIDGTLVYNPIFEHYPTEWIMDGVKRRDSVGRVTTINGERWAWRVA